MDEKLEHTTARTLLCDNALFCFGWTADNGLCRWLRFNEDGTGALFGSRQLIRDIYVDLTWTGIGLELDKPPYLPSSAHKGTELLAEVKLELKIYSEPIHAGDSRREHMASPGAYTNPGPFTEHNSLQVLGVRLERGRFTPSHNSACIRPAQYELRLVFDSSPYLTRHYWAMTDSPGGIGTLDYWEHKAFLARPCKTPEEPKKGFAGQGFFQTVINSCVMS